MLRPKVRRRIATDPIRSLDEQISNVFQEILREAQEIDDPGMRDLWVDAIQTFGQTGDVSSLIDVTKWRRPVVDLDEFLFGEGYLGLEENEVYPGVLKALHDIDSDIYDEVIEKGALGIGKTTLANLAMARDLYKLSCMRSPQATYGIAKGSPMVFTIQSIRLSTARKVVFSEFGRYAKNSPYFKQYFPFDPLITSEMIFRQHNIHIMPISSAGTGVISMNVVGGQLDEANFMNKSLHSKSQNADEDGGIDQAKQLYNTLASRRKSRFTHRAGLPGALYLISSSRFPDDFTEIKAAESTQYGGNDARIYVFEGSQWSVKGRDKFSPENFQVQIGNETFPSKVLENGMPPNPGCETIDVPMDFLEDFKRDVNGAIRDFAGRTTLATHPFITQRDKIAAANELAAEHGYLNPFSVEEAEFSIGIPRPNMDILRTDVTAWRHAHVDLGLRKDACGIAVGHIAGHKVSENKNEETGKIDFEVLPVIAYDVIMRVVPPLGGEIQLADIRKFLIRLNKTYKLGIKYVTFDGFQSADSRQLLNKQGFIADYLSVEKPEPWRTFKDALYDGRVLLPTHNYLNKELAEVETTTHNNKEKIDHRANGTKDVADAVVGVASFLFRRKIAWKSIAYHGNRTGIFLIGDAGGEQRAKRANRARQNHEDDETVYRAGGARKPSVRRRIPRRSINRR